MKFKKGDIVCTDSITSIIRILITEMKNPWNFSGKILYTNHKYFKTGDYGEAYNPGAFEIDLDYIRLKKLVEL